MRVVVSSPALVPDLLEFLGRIPCSAGAVRGPLVDVLLPEGDEVRERRHLELYLAAWCALHPPVHVDFVDGEPS